MKVFGIMVLNLVEFMFGLMVIVLKVNGLMDVDMDLVLNIEENGFIKVSGRKVLKCVMVCRSCKVGCVMREVGCLDYKKVMELRFMLMKVGFVIIVWKGSVIKV